MEKFRFILINDLKVYMRDRAFLKAHLLYLVILSLVVILGWPGGAFPSFQRPWVFLALSYAQIIILSYISGRLAVQSSFMGEASLGDWLRYTHISPMDIALGRFLGIFLYTLLMFSSSLPLVILCYFIGGVFLKSALIIYALLPLFLITFINFGLLFTLMWREYFSVFILNLLSLFFVLGLFLTRTGWRELFYLNPRFILFVFILSFFAFFAFVISLRKMVAT